MRSNTEVGPGEPNNFRLADYSPGTGNPVFSLHRDHDLAVVSACAKMTKGFPRFAQLIRAVDHGDQLSGFKTFVQVWQVLVLLQHNQAEVFVCGLPNAPPENYKLEQLGQLYTDGGVCPPGIERARVREWGTSGFCIEDQVVAPAVPDE